KLAAQERDDVVTAGTPARGPDVAVTFLRDLACLPDAEEIRRIVERAEMVRGVKPAVVNILMALHAVVVHHQDVGADEVAVGRPRLGRLEIALPLLGPYLADLPRVEGVHHAH